MNAGIGQGEQHREAPDDAEDPEGAPPGALQLGAEGVENGHVALHADRGDAEDGGEAHGLKEGRLEVASHGPKQEGVVAPHLIDFQGHPKEQDEEVGDGQAEEVVVGGGLHSLVPQDHQAHQEITNDSHRKNQRIHHRHWEKEVAAWRPTEEGQVVLGAVQVFLEWIFQFLLGDPGNILRFFHTEIKIQRRPEPPLVRASVPS